MATYAIVDYPPTAAQLIAAIELDASELRRSNDNTKCVLEFYCCPTAPVEFDGMTHYNNEEIQDIITTQDTESIWYETVVP